MEPRKPSLALTLALFLSVAAMIAASVLVWEVDIHITLILGAMLTIAVGVVVLKYDYASIEKGIIDGIMTGMQACLILYTVGPLIGTWILSGVVPTMIYYGLAIQPVHFPFCHTAHLLCSITVDRYIMGHLGNCRYSTYGYRARAWHSGASDCRCSHFRSILRRQNVPAF